MTEIPGADEHPNARVLRTLYADPTCIADYAHDDIVYHLATRDLPGHPAPLRGKTAATAHEQAFRAAMGGTLRAELDAVIANDFFGTVLGTFHGTVREQPFSFGFCGVWRFCDGLITHHWQNAHDPALVATAITVT